MTAIRAKKAPVTIGRRIRPDASIFTDSAVTMDPFSGIQVHHRQRTTPDTASIQAAKPVDASLTFKSGPVPEDDTQIIGAREFKPGGKTLGRAADGFFGGQFKLAIAGNKTHPGEVIGDDPPTIHTIEVLIPTLRFIAVHQRKIFRVMLSANDFFHFPGSGQSLLNAPDMGYPGMGHHEVTLGIVYTQILLTQPAHQLIAIRGAQYFCKCIFALWRVATK